MAKSEKHAMIAATAIDLLGAYSATVVSAEDFQTRLLHKHPEFMDGIKVQRKNQVSGDLTKNHVHGVVADYAGVGREPQRPADGPVIKIEYRERPRREHDRYKIHRSMPSTNAPTKPDEVEMSPDVFQVTREGLATAIVEQAKSPNERGVADREQKVELLKQLSELDQTDLPSITKRRAEQEIVRKILLRNGPNDVECALCGATFETAYVEACHIVDRCDMSEAERKADPEVYATLLCLHCHKAFDLRHVTVNESDIVELSMPSAKHRRLDHLEGRTVIMKSDQQRKYYARHRETGPK